MYAGQRATLPTRSRRPLMRCFFLCYLNPSKNSILVCYQTKCFRESGCKGKGFYITVQEFRKVFAWKALLLTLVCISKTPKMPYTLLYNARIAENGSKSRWGKNGVFCRKKIIFTRGEDAASPTEYIFELNAWMNIIAILASSRLCQVLFRIYTE